MIVAHLRALAARCEIAVAQVREQEAWVRRADVDAASLPYSIAATR